VKGPDGNARNQIDHILIDSRHIFDLLDLLDLTEERTSSRITSSLEPR